MPTATIPSRDTSLDDVLAFVDDQTYKNGEDAICIDASDPLPYDADRELCDLTNGLWRVLRMEPRDVAIVRMSLPVIICETNPGVKNEFLLHQGRVDCQGCIALDMPFGITLNGSMTHLQPGWIPEDIPLDWLRKQHPTSFKRAGSSGEGHKMAMRLLPRRKELGLKRELMFEDDFHTVRFRQAVQREFPHVFVASLRPKDAVTYIVEGEDGSSISIYSACIPEGSAMKLVCSAGDLLPLPDDLYYIPSA